jgi:hypothetical protein
VGTGPLCLTLVSCPIIVSPPQSSAITHISIVVPPVCVSLMYDNYLSRVIRMISAASPLPHVHLMLTSFLIPVLVVLESLCT